MKMQVSHFIGGELERGGRRQVRKSPWTEADFVEYPIGGPAEVDMAVDAAVRAGHIWSSLTFPDRARLIEKMASVLEAEYGSPGEATAWKKSISEEVGKPLPEADVEVIECADFIRYFCAIASTRKTEEKLSLDQKLWPSKISTISWRPYGVVAIIKPWNYPIEMIIWSLIPALLAGNTVLIKPSEHSPGSADLIRRLCQAAELPAGTVNIVHGDGSTGETIVKHPGVGFVSFTGSRAVGLKVGRICNDRLIPSILELSGNDAALVLNDADIDTTANGLVWGAFANAGQVCVGIKRAYIETGVYDALRKKILEKTARLIIGKDIGPLISSEARVRFEKFIKRIRRSNQASVLAGGNIRTPGYFVEPTILEVSRDVEQDLLADDVFAPVLPLVRVDDAEEGIFRANSSDYGLGASIWSADPDRAMSLAHGLEVGMVWINDVNVAFPQAPWPARKMSGVGFELSSHAIDHYTQPQHINREDSSDHRRAWWYPYD